MANTATFFRESYPKATKVPFSVQVSPSNKVVLVFGDTLVVCNGNEADFQLLYQTSVVTNPALERKIFQTDKWPLYSGKLSSRLVHSLCVKNNRVDDDAFFNKVCWSPCNNQGVSILATTTNKSFTSLYRPSLQDGDATLECISIDEVAVEDHTLISMEPVCLAWLDAGLPFHVLAIGCKTMASVVVLAIPFGAPIEAIACIGCVSVRAAGTNAYVTAIQWLKVEEGSWGLVVGTSSGTVSVFHTTLELHRWADDLTGFALVHHHDILNVPSCTPITEIAVCDNTIALVRSHAVHAVVYSPQGPPPSESTTSVEGWQGEIFHHKMVTGIAVFKDNNGIPTICTLGLQGVLSMHAVRVTGTRVTDSGPFYTTQLVTLHPSDYIYRGNDPLLHFTPLTNREDPLGDCFVASYGLAFSPNRSFVYVLHLESEPKELSQGRIRQMHSIVTQIPCLHQSITDLGDRIRWMVQPVVSQSIKAGVIQAQDLCRWVTSELLGMEEVDAGLKLVGTIESAMHGIFATQPTESKGTAYHVRSVSWTRAVANALTSNLLVTPTFTEEQRRNVMEGIHTVYMRGLVWWVLSCLSSVNETGLEECASVDGLEESALSHADFAIWVVQAFHGTWGEAWPNVDELKRLSEKVLAKFGATEGFPCRSTHKLFEDAAHEMVPFKKTLDKVDVGERFGLCAEFQDTKFSRSPITLRVIVDEPVSLCASCGLACEADMNDLKAFYCRRLSRTDDAEAPHWTTFTCPVCFCKLERVSPFQGKPVQPAADETHNMSMDVDESMVLGVSQKTGGLMPAV